MSTVCKIGIKFLILPNAANNRTLISADFMEQVGIVLNLGQRYWHFEGNPGLTLHTNYILRIDASAFPLRAVLIQGQNPIEYASRVCYSVLREIIQQRKEKPLPLCCLALNFAATLKVKR